MLLLYIFPLDMHFIAVKLNLIILFHFIISSWAADCHDAPVKLDDEFVSCCRGRPTYTSEPCVDALLENNTLSSECIINCIYREFEIYDGETINMASVKTFLETQIPQDEEFVSMYMNAFEECSKLDKDTIAKKFMFYKMDNEHGCDEFPPLIDMCVWYHTLANCPTSHATDSETCNNKMHWVNECIFWTVGIL